MTDVGIGSPDTRSSGGTSTPASMISASLSNRTSASSGSTAEGIPFCRSAIRLTPEEFVTNADLRSGA